MHFLAWLKPRRTGRSIRNAYRVPVARVPEGALVKVVGRLRHASGALSAPITGRSCACWQVVVGSPIVHEEHRARDFLVEDETGSALVRATAARLSLVKDVGASAGEGGPARAYARRAGFVSKEVDGVGVREGVLAAGEEVAVFGIGRWEPDPIGAAAGATYREVPDRLVIVAPARGVVECSNDPFAVA